MNSMKGRICMVTGATNGLGEVTARDLAALGATVVLVGRNLEKTRRVVRSLKADTGNRNITYYIADLASMTSIHRLAEDFQRKYDQLHVLVNNAASIFLDRRVTPEGLEMTFALNHIGYFLLTNLLLDPLTNGGDAERHSRVVNVSGVSHERAKLDFDNLQNIQGYNGLKAYAQSKLMNIMFTNELSRRVRQAGAPVDVNALHPGVVRTGILQDITSGVSGTLINNLSKAFSPLGMRPEKGADTQVYLATSPDVEGLSGKYFVKRQARPSSPASMVEEDWRRLWDYSERVTGLQERQAAS